MIDEVIALIRGSASAAAAKVALQEFLDIDEVQAGAILDLQLRKLAALERQELQDEYDRLVAEITDLEDILARDERKREIVRDACRDRRQVRRRAPLDHHPRRGWPTR